MFGQSMLPLQSSQKTLNVVQRRDFPTDMKVPIPVFLSQSYFSGS